jgi:glycosyltransferase involved in cell wall biosynthesis
MRYLYDQGGAYRAKGSLAGRIAGRGLHLAGPGLARWDRAAARRADHVWAISRFVAARIEAVWGRKARVIYPPVRTERFVPPPADQARRDEALIVSALVPYKRVELALEAANRLGRPLRVVGGGPLLGRMRQLAGPTVAVEGPVGEARLAWFYQTRRMLIFPTEEDFGIVPLEAMASGMPALGLGSGGLLETLRPGVCGEFFDSPTVDALAQAWEAFEPDRYDPAAMRAHAETFSVARFQDEIIDGLAEALGLQ